MKHDGNAIGANLPAQSPTLASHRNIQRSAYMAQKIDLIARDVALQRYALPVDLHVPIAAVSEQAIADYVGPIVRTLSGRTPHKAFLVQAHPPVSMDERLPIWKLGASAILHKTAQVWVHIAYTAYRAAYCRAFPEENVKGRVLSHAMNRRVAALRGLNYVRITPVSRRANSSSAFSENWSVALHTQANAKSSRSMHRQQIEYADLTGLLLMMDYNLGGGVMETVNEAQALVTRN